MGTWEHLKAGLEMKCPRCHQGPMFSQSALNLRKFDQMPEKCPVCGFRYEVELGFYWGAMYMSYGLSVFIVFLVGISLYFLANDPPTWVYLTTVAFTILVFTPILFRYARVMMLYFFGSVSFDPKYKRS
ncbi:DUF983 domain-containing protein [Rufibacter roseolus]|uniref:DUF983 domain-containing protein n=1 Tax=Rufibacter roseolus TaxID=2817375 RepID=UPI00293D550D|nr:DUF983 domain-containing protein [Rufibacter roseolus]